MEEAIFKISGMTCEGCAATVTKSLKQISGVQEVSVDLGKAEARLTVREKVSPSQVIEALQPYPAYRIIENGHQVQKAPSFWADVNTWKRASLNTLNCLIGCSIGDFGMIIYLQAYYPGTSMTAQMILAIIAGLCTSVTMETMLLKWREKFTWPAAFRTAISMSFLSMIAMEVVMNATDFMITGGKAAFENPVYWSALVVSMAAGFLAPLPYNYYKLRKYNRACH
jgi:copper chaperone CopZ